MKITLNSNLLPSEYRPDTYSTYDIADHIDGDWNEDQNYDQQGWVLAVSKKILSWIDDNVDLEGSGITLINKVLSTHSPREYNFETDSFTFEVEVDIQMLKDWAWDHTDFDDYLKEEYSSRDGFISFMPSSIGQFFGDGWEWEDDRATACVLSFILSQYEFDWTQLELTEDAYNLLT